MRTLLSLAALTLSMPAGAETKRLEVAVMDLASDGLPEQLVKSLSAIVPEALEETGIFEAISSAEIRRILEFETTKQAFGCEDSACFAEIGGALGVDYLVNGSVVLVGDVYLIQLQLQNIREARTEERVSREYQGGPQGLIDAVKSSSKRLVTNLLDARSGVLELTVSEEGATVRIDGTIIGVSPLEPQKVAGGVHTLAVEREGFIRHLEDVEIKSGESNPVSVELLPSDEFKREYTASARTTRTLAWIGIGVGAASLIGSGVVLGVRSGQASDLTTRINDYNDLPVRTAAQAQDLEGEREAIARLDSVSLALMLTGAAAAGAGAFLFFAGDDPNRYDSEPAVAVGPEVGLLITPWGVSLQGGF